MRLWFRDIKQPLSEDDALLPQRLKAQFGLDASAFSDVRVARRALDARKKQDIHFLLGVLADVDEPAAKRLLSRGDARVEAYWQIAAAPLRPGAEPLGGRAVVVGLGPAGLFAALLLAEHGYAPLVIERGEPVERRVADVGRYWNTGALNEESNVMFGEGGAGTFSDGKLTSRSKDARGLLVLETFARFGAPPEILTDAKPHIGTDRLREVVPGMRREIERLGGEVRFSTRLDGVFLRDGRLSGVRLATADGAEEMPCGALVLAIGQGARDTYQMLRDAGVAMQPKPFAVGVRIEHPQTLIDRAQFGDSAGHARLGAAEYRLTGRSGERGVYTFCMCPGGRVIASASQNGEVVVNGMSGHRRDAENANAAIVVQVCENDLPTGPLGGVCFQRELEQAAFVLGGANAHAPASRVADFLEKRTPRGFGGVNPSYRPGVTVADLWRLLPPFVAAGVRDGIAVFARQLAGFDLGDAVLTGVETRTSAPLRLLRGETMESVSCAGLYPAGEGAGYAGGIVSAAIDGLKAAERIVERYAPPG